MSAWRWRLGRYGLRDRHGFLAVLFLSALCAGLEVIRPWPLKLIVDNSLGSEPLPARLAWLGHLPGAGLPAGLLAWLTAATILLFLGGWAGRMAQSCIQTVVGSRMVYSLASDLFHHLQRLSLRFHGRQATGDLVKRVTTDAGCVRQLLMGVAVPMLSSTASIAGMVAVMWKVDAALAAMAFVAVPIMFLCIRRFARPMEERAYLQYELQGEVMALAEQVLTAIPVVKAYGGEKKEGERFRALWHRSDQAYLKTIAAQLHFKMSTGTVSALGTAAVLALGGFRAARGDVSIGTLVLFLSYLASFYSPLESLAYLSTEHAAAAAGARRVFEILDSEDAVREAPAARPLPADGLEKAGHVRIEGVTFGYEPGRPVLRGVSLEARPGEAIAIVGPTGAGKSTLVSLIPRFFDPWEGTVRIGGMDLRELQIQSLRSRISLVLQETFILPLSVADNIAYGRPGAGREEIENAARAANADEFILRLPQSYDTVVGERGSTLSVGQRQRLAIARALLKDAPILILDEPTSALDAQTESLVFEALKRLMQGRTTFIIAHRLSTARNADRVVVMRSGEIVESGDHESLLSLGGLYSGLAQS